MKQKERQGFCVSSGRGANVAFTATALLSMVKAYLLPPKSKYNGETLRLSPPRLVRRAE